MRWPARWPLQPSQPFQKTQLQPLFGPSVDDSLCHPWFTTTNLSYRFAIFETSATALCGTTGIILCRLNNVNPFRIVYPRRCLDNQSPLNELTVIDYITWYEQRRPQTKYLVELRGEQKSWFPSIHPLNQDIEYPWIPCQPTIRYFLLLKALTCCTPV